MLNLRDVVMLGIGAAVGTVGSYIFLSKKYQQEIEEETKEMRDFARKKIAEAEGRQKIAEDYADKLQAMVVDDEESDEVNEPIESGTDGINEEYEELAHEYDGSEEAPPEGDSDPVYLISEDEYNDEHAHDYAKNNLIYYQLDGTLATDADDIVDNVNYIVGDCIDQMNAQGAWKTCWIRNDKISQDFQVDNVLAAFNPD